VKSLGIHQDPLPSQILSRSDCRMRSPPVGIVNHTASIKRPNQRQSSVFGVPCIRLEAADRSHRAGGEPPEVDGKSESGTKKGVSEAMNGLKRESASENLDKVLKASASVAYAIGHISNLKTNL
jgi:hypothetical protein